MKRFIAALFFSFAMLTASTVWSQTTRTVTFTQTLNTTTKTSDPFDPQSYSATVGAFSVSVTGTFSAKWRLQQSLDAGVTWVDFYVIDQPEIVPIPIQANALWRVSAAGVGDFTSGSAEVKFQKGGAQAATPLTRIMTKDHQPVSTTNPLPVSGEAAIPSGTLTKSTKTTAYSSGQLITQGVAGSSAAIAVQVARANDKTGMLRRARLKVNDATWLNATIRVHVFKNNPTFTNGDAANFAAGVSESNHICEFDVVLERSFSDPLVKGVGVPLIGTECNFEPATGTRNVYAVLEARSTTAGSHTASSVFTLTLESLQN